MGFFRRKKVKNKEEINLNINLDDNFNFEEENIEKTVETKEISQEQLIEEILSTFDYITSKNSKMIKEFYICKIFSRVGLKDLEFNLKIVAIDKNVNRIKKECLYLSEVIEKLKTGYVLDLAGYQILHKQVTDLKAFQHGVLDHLTEMNNVSYGHLKISTVTVTINKSNEELEVLYNSISKEIASYKSFEEASEYIYYNSGEFIEQIVNGFINCVLETTNEDLIKVYNKSYFLPSDVVLALDVKEWIELYNKLKFVLKYLTKYKTVSYPICYDLFNEFEAKYAILMMRTERSKK